MADNVEPARATDDWPAQATDAIVRAVDQVREKTTGPAITAARALVYGVVLGVLGTTLLVVLVITLIRVLDVYLPSAVFGDEHIWVVYGLLGILFAVLGAYMLSKAKRVPVA